MADTSAEITGVNVRTDDGSVTVTAHARRIAYGIEFVAEATSSCSWDYMEDRIPSTRDASAGAVARAIDQVDAAVDGYRMCQGDGS